MKNKERIKKFISFYKPYKALFWTDMLFALIGACITLIYPMIVRYITNDILVKYEIQTAVGMIVKLLLCMGGLLILEYICTYYMSYQGHMMGTRMEADMRSEIFKHYQKLSFGFYDNRKTGQLLTRVTNDLFDITELCHHGPEDIVISFIKIIGAFIILLNVNVKLTLIVFAFIPIMIIFASYMKTRMKKAFKNNREKIADINAQLEDNLSGIRVVKSFGNEEIEIKKFEVGNQNFIQSKKNSYRNMAKFHSGLGAFISLINIAVIGGGGYFIVKSAIDVSDLLTFLLYINNLIDPIKKLINFTEQFQNGMTGFERFMEIIEIEPEIVDRENAIELRNVKGDIEFTDVAFSYEEVGKTVFQNINLSVEAGSYVALVGSSGVGKTTMCNLIPRFYEVSEGSIQLDGHDIRDIKLSSLRGNIGVVQQDVFLFSGTVFDNIRYGKLDATEEEVIRAAKNANAHEFILSLPNGYYTDIGQRGVKLSGGQKQRLSIARVFLKNPPVLIFDEATSALDNESEHIVQESLERLAKNRTTFVIAHRLSTIRNAKEILVLTENGIAERGTHQELLERNGMYAALYHTNFA